MAGEPKRRHSKSAKRIRRASIVKIAPNLVECKNCTKLTLPHTICKECGYYGNKKVTSEKVKVVKV